MEAADLDQLNQARQETQAEMDNNLAETNRTLDTMRDEVNITLVPSHCPSSPDRLLWPGCNTLHPASPGSLAFDMDGV